MDFEKIGEVCPIILLVIKNIIVMRVYLSSSNTIEVVKNMGCFGGCGYGGAGYGYAKLWWCRL